MYNKQIKNIFFLGAIILFGVISCNKIDKPYAPVSPTGTDTTAIVKTRKLLLEEFTGHTCVNCPKGALTVHSIQHEFSGKVISISYHAGLFAIPQPTPSLYTQDFRNSVSTGYASLFQITAYPTAMLNRENFLAGKHRLEESDKWRDTVVAYKDKAPDAFLTISNSYSSPVLTTTVTCEFLNMLTGNYSLVVFLTEDSVIAPQKNGTTALPSDPAYPNPDASNYVNMHMMRACISDPTGAGIQIVNGSVAAGDTLVKTFSYSLPANFNGAPPVGTVPVEDHCHVVAFIYNTATQEVVQAEEAKMK